MSLVVDIRARIEISFKPRKKKLATRIAILNEQSKETKMELIKVDNKRTLSTKAVDDSGKERPTDASPYVWTASATGIVSLFPTPDGRQCDAVGLAPGTVTLTVTGDADPGSPTVPIVGTVDIQVDAVLATKIEVTAGPEVPAGT